MQMLVWHTLRQAAVSPAASLQTIQARLPRARLGAFGALLGDKAAEVTALAQASFTDMALPSALSDMSLPSALTSALGTGSSGAAGLLSSLRGFQPRD